MGKMMMRRRDDLAIVPQRATKVTGALSAGGSEDDAVLADTPVPYMPDVGMPGMRRSDSSRQMQEMSRIAGGKFSSILVLELHA